MFVNICYVKNYKHQGITLPDHAINIHASFYVKVQIVRRRNNICII